MAWLVITPFQWCTTVALVIKGPYPRYEFFYDLLGEIALVPPPKREVNSLELRKPWAATAPVDEVIADEYPVCLSVVQHVVSIRGSIFKAVVRIYLAPFVGDFVAVIDTVTEGFFDTGAKGGTLFAKARVIPVRTKRHSFRYAHGINQITGPILGFRTSTDYPVPNGGRHAQTSLTGG